MVTSRILPDLLISLLFGSKVFGHSLLQKQVYTNILNDNAQKTAERTAKLEQRTSEAEAQAKRSEAEIAKANAAAHEADARAANSQSEVAKANSESQKAGAAAAVAQAQVAIAQKEAAQANQIAESERLARLRLELRLAPRTLTADQQKRLIRLLTAFPKTSADVYVFEDGAESRAFAEVLLNCLISAGWIVHSGYVSNENTIVRGVEVSVQPGASNSTMGAGGNLVNELQYMGITTHLKAFDEMNFSGAIFTSSITTPSQIRIYIGSKP